MQLGWFELGDPGDEAGAFAGAIGARATHLEATDIAKRRKPVVPATPTQISARRTTDATPLAEAA